MYPYDLHAYIYCFGVSKEMLRVKYFCSNKTPFCIHQISLRSHDCHKDEVNSGHPQFLGYYRISNTYAIMYTIKIVTYQISHNKYLNIKLACFKNTYNSNICLITYIYIYKTLMNSTGSHMHKKQDENSNMSSSTNLMTMTSLNVHVALYIYTVVP